MDVGKSVSRVGGKAQRAAYREVAGPLKLDYAQVEVLEVFARFGTRLDEHTRGVIEHGKRIRACLRQDEFQPVPVIEQLAVLLALTSGLFDVVPLERMSEAEAVVRRIATALPEDMRERIISGAILSAADRDTVVQKSRDALRPLLTVRERDTVHPAPKD